MTYFLVISRNSSCYAVILSFYIKMLFGISVSITEKTFTITKKFVVLTRNVDIFFFVNAICCHT